MHFCVSATRAGFHGAFRCPKKIGTNWFMPALVKSRFGASGNSDEDGTIVCCFSRKKSRNDCRICAEVINPKLNATSRRMRELLQCFRSSPTPRLIVSFYPEAPYLFRHENNNYISRRVVRFRCLRARAGCHEGGRDFGAKIREPGYWHGHFHKHWRRSTRRCRLPKPKTGKARFPHTRERRLLGAGCDVSRPAFQSEASTPRRTNRDGASCRRFRQC